MGFMSGKRVNHENKNGLCTMLVIISKIIRALKRLQSIIASYIHSPEKWVRQVFNNLTYKQSEAERG